MANRRIDELLTRRARRSEFTRLLAHADSREAWTAALRALLPAEIARECHVANVRDHVLTVHLTTAAWATRFRFLAPDLLRELNRLADFAAVREFRIKVAPVSAPAANVVDDHRERQPPDGQALARFADDLDYGELREAILRLARHAQPTDGAHAGMADVPQEGPAADA
jgi:hypothetical protein